MLGWVVTPAQQNTNVGIAASCTIGTISIATAGVYILSLLGTIRIVDSQPAAFASMSVPNYTASIVFSALSGAGGGYYQTATTSIALSVTANYTYNVTLNINPTQVGSVNQMLFNYNYVRIA